MATREATPPPSDPGTSPRPASRAPGGGASGTAPAAQIPPQPLLGGGSIRPPQLHHGATRARYAPEIGAAIVTPSAKVVKRITPRVTGHVNLPPSTYQPLLAGFEGAINNSNGTAAGLFTNSKFPMNQLAGKTGTADTVPGKEPTGWFVGWGPVSSPQYVVACAIEEAGYGAGTCAPVVNAIFNYLATTR